MGGGQLHRTGSRARARLPARARRGPRPRRGDGHEDPSPVTVYYLAPDLARPSGGVRTIYRHVDALNRSGISAAVVHARRGFRCAWFANETAIVHPPLALAASDLLVVPEEHAPRLA